MPCVLAFVVVESFQLIQTFVIFLDSFAVLGESFSYVFGGSPCVRSLQDDPQSACACVRALILLRAEFDVFDVVYQSHLLFCEMIRLILRDDSTWLFCETIRLVADHLRVFYVVVWMSVGVVFVFLASVVLFMCVVLLSERVCLRSIHLQSQIGVPSIIFSLLWFHVYIAVVIRV